ncbi:hypothetical protein [Streptococcus pneumoniae]|uniref:hypothetical protein n=1 Tax=Streptococcus pneumoniae TaxID=1313 RepID=UPI0015DB21AB|nr:hypothetical protein [Streptococcus pneumoniae]
MQTRKLAAGCSKHGFEVADRTDEVSNITYDKAKLTRFEEIFEEELTWFKEIFERGLKRFSKSISH